MVGILEEMRWCVKSLFSGLQRGAKYKLSTHADLDEE